MVSAGSSCCCTIWTDSFLKSHCSKVPCRFWCAW